MGKREVQIEDNTMDSLYNREEKQAMPFTAQVCGSQSMDKQISQDAGQYCYMLECSTEYSSINETGQNK